MGQDIINKKTSKKKKKKNSLIESSDVMKLSTEQKYNLIADLSESVLENPNSSFFSEKHGANLDEDTSGPKTPSKVKKLLDLAVVPNGEKNLAENEEIARLAMISLLAIFQDVLPSYRIRLPTTEEMSVRVTKETKKLWQYERALLTHYQWYLKILESTWEKGNSASNEPPTALALTAIITLCELLKTAPHFNFRSNILSIVTRQANNRKSDQVVKSCCNAITHIFSNDPQGEVSLETTKILTKMVHSRKFQVRPEVIRTFLHLPLRVHQDEAEAAKIAQKAQTKKRKRNSEGAEEADIENELRDYSGAVDKIALARNQADTLQAVILTYFRILKADPKEKNVEALLPEALQGLAKFSHLIHFDTVLDLLNVLKKLLESVDVLPLDAALNAVLAAFQTLQGPGRELQIDQKEYVIPLYTQLTRLVSTNAHSTLPAILNCLTLAFLKRREYSTVRIAAFFKQILTTCLHTETHLSIPLLAFARQLLQRYSSTNQLLENESDIITSGAYTPNVLDPEHSNPFATSAWELGLLKFHIDPMMGKHHAQSCAENRILQYPMEAPDRLFEERMRHNVERGYIGCRVRCKKHPFRNSVMNNSNNERKKRGRQREQYRFVKARKTTGLHLKSFQELI